MHSTSDEFLQAIVTAGLAPPLKIISDGKLHRFSTNGKRDDESGWYVFHDDDIPAGSFGDWRTGLKANWSAKQPGTMTTEERATYRKRLDSIKRQREDEVRRCQAAAAAKARKIWNAAQPATDEHPYLLRKKVKSHNLRQHRDGRLIVPVCDVDGAMHSVEFIDDDGGKKFLAGGRKRGCCYTLGHISDVVCLAEGYATGASVQEATSLPVAVAFDAGNLLFVARALRHRHPRATILICADRDKSGVGQKSGRLAAEDVKGFVVIPEEEGCDWNDVHVRCGLGVVKVAIDAALAKTKSARINAEEDPEPIALESIAIPAFPVGCIPVQWLHEMVEAVAQATETPPELPCLLSLSVVSTAVQRSFCVEPELGYVEHLPIWTCVVMESGGRKTAVLKEVTRPLLAFERRQAAQLAQSVREAEAARKLADDRIKHLRHRAARARGADLEALRASLLEEESALPEVPREPRLWAQDVTPERLGQLMADHGGAMSILSDEGGIFDILAGRYSQGLVNLDLFLQAFSGAPHRVDRGSRPAVFLELPLLAIGLSPQPDVLKGLAKHPSFRGRGLLARFFYAVPPSTLGFRRLQEQPIPDEVRNRYGAAVTALLARPAPSGGGLHRLTFAPDAYSEWKAFQLHVEAEMRPGGTFEHLKDWASKCPGGAARLAGILHCAKFAHDEPADHAINLETTAAALTLAATLERHAVAAFALLAVDPILEGARLVWSWIERHQRRTFSRRDLFLGLRSTFQTVEELRPALSALVERSYLFPVTSPRREGRPTYRYRVSDRLSKGWAS